MFIIPHVNRDTEEFGTKCNRKRIQQQQQLEMWANAQRDGPLPNIGLGGAVCATPQSLAYASAVE